MRNAEGRSNAPRSMRRHHVCNGNKHGNKYAAYSWPLYGLCLIHGCLLHKNRICKLM